VDSGLDHIVFTISGMTQDSYARYHVNGRLDSALRGMRNVVEARRAAGTTRPKISWRYLGFRWTDDFEQLDAALSLATELEVEDFSIYLTHIPEDGWSYRLAQGTYGYSRYRRWINVAHGYNRPPAPAQGLFPPEEMPGFGTVQWTNWHARPALRVENGKLTFWLSTNSPAAAIAGATDVFLRTPWRRIYKVRAPYCALGQVSLDLPSHWWGRKDLTIDIFCPDAWFPKDWLGVEDYRSLGVLITQSPNGTLPQRPAVMHPASLQDCQRYMRNTPAAALKPVASALFVHKKDREAR
jgi:hypothetical protein